GYDSEANHLYARDEHGVRSVIPAKIGRPTDKPPTGKWRRLMRSLLRTKRKRRRSGYTQRWQVETVVSMVKRNLGCELSARSYWARAREMMLRVLTHNISILLLFLRFSTEQVLSPFSR